MIIMRLLMLNLPCWLMKDSPSVAKAQAAPSHHQVVEWAHRGVGMTRLARPVIPGYRFAQPRLRFRDHCQAARVEHSDTREFRALLEQSGAQLVAGFQQNGQEAAL
ncbi:hypothetical protein Pstr01_26040 [Pseudomonas straminea]|nr:hypothetical protein Pstr01_26040 [Pseudomonas straminea]